MNTKQETDSAANQQSNGNKTKRSNNSNSHSSNNKISHILSMHDEFKFKQESLNLNNTVKQLHNTKNENSNLRNSISKIDNNNDKTIIKEDLLVKEKLSIEKESSPKNKQLNISETELYGDDLSDNSDMSRGKYEISF